MSCEDQALGHRSVGLLGTPPCDRRSVLAVWHRNARPGKRGAPHNPVSCSPALPGCQGSCGRRAHHSPHPSAPRPGRPSGKAGRSCRRVWRWGRKVHTLFQRQCAPAGKQQPLCGMDQQAHRAIPAAPGPQRPGIEGMIRRAAKRKECLGPQITGHMPDHPARPAIHRVGCAIPPFRLRRQMRPVAGFAGAQQQQGAGALRQTRLIPVSGETTQD